MPTQNVSEALSVLQAEGRTDTANARRFVAQHGQDIRWCDPWDKWLVWDGRRWAIDDQRKVEALAKQTAGALWMEVIDELTNVTPAESKPLLAFATKTADAKGISGMLAMARSELAVLPNQLDAHPWLFNCTNGTVDLKTGELLAHGRNRYLTTLCPHDYDATAAAPIWESVLQKVYGGCDDMVLFFGRLCGSAMVGEVIDHILPILWGEGSNGKSLIVETLMEAMGTDYATSGADDLLLASQGNRHPTEKADLYGKRLVICSETDDGRRLSEGLVKKLTGGDTITARRMKEDFWKFKPSHTFMLVTNHKPVVRGTDHGLWRRLQLLPFVQKFWLASKGESGPPLFQADPLLKSKLRPEMPGIVRWLVAACLDWQQHGLPEPVEVKAATQDYRESQDTIGRFVDELCILADDAIAKLSDLRRNYEAWCAENGERPASGRGFGEYLKKLPVTKRVSNGTWYDGIGLKA